MVHQKLEPVVNHLKRQGFEYDRVVTLNLRTLESAENIFNGALFDRVNFISGGDSAIKPIIFCEEWIKLRRNDSLIVFLEALKPVHPFLAEDVINRISTIRQRLDKNDDYCRNELDNAIENHTRRCSAKLSCLICLKLSPSGLSLQPTEAISAHQSLTYQPETIRLLYKDHNIPCTGESYICYLRSNLEAQVRERLKYCCRNLEKWQALLLHGDGGVGKTTMMSYVIKEQSSNIFLAVECQICIVIWINAYEMSEDFKNDRFYEAVRCHLKQAFISKPELKSLLIDIEAKDTDHVAWLEELSLTLDRHDRRILLVVDDANHPAIPQSVHLLGPGFRLVAISRKFDLQANNNNIIATSNSFEVRHLDADETAKIMFGSNTKYNTLSIDYKNLVEACEGLPLVADLIRLQLKKFNNEKLKIQLAQKILTRIGETKTVPTDPKTRGNEGARTVTALLQLTIEMLADPQLNEYGGKYDYRDLFWRLLMFAEGQLIDAADLKLVWNVSTLDVSSICIGFFTYNLIQEQKITDDNHPAEQDARDSDIYFRVHSLQRSAAFSSARKSPLYEDVNTIDEWRTKFVSTELVNFAPREFPEGVSTVQACIEARRYSLLETICQSATPEAFSRPFLLSKAQVFNLEKCRMEPPLSALVQKCDLPSWNLLSRCCEKLLQHPKSASAKSDEICWFKFVNTCVEYLISENKKFVGDYKDSILTIAVQQGCVGFCKALIDELKDQHGPNIVSEIINYPNKRDRTALHLAAMGVVGDSVAIMKVLLDEKPNVDAGDGAMITPLGHAAITGNFEMAKLLVNNGASPDARYNNGMSPRKSAKRHHRDDIVELFNKIQISIPIDEKYAFKYPLHHLVIHDRLDRLLKITNVDDFFAVRDDKLASNIFQIAAMSGRLALIEYVLRLDPGIKNVDLGDKWQGTALFRAAELGHLPVVIMLVEYGASIEKAAFNGTNPMHAAAIGGHDDIVKFLLEQEKVDNIYKAQTSKKTYCRTPLHSAAGFGHTSVVRALLEYSKTKSDISTHPEDDFVNAKDTEDSTPLHYACKFGHPDAALVLMDNQANLNALNRYRLKPVDLIPSAKKHLFPAKVFGFEYNHDPYMKWSESPVSSNCNHTCDKTYQSPGCSVL